MAQKLSLQSRSSKEFAPLKSLTGGSICTEGQTDAPTTPGREVCEIYENNCCDTEATRPANTQCENPLISRLLAQPPWIT